MNATTCTRDPHTWPKGTAVKRRNSTDARIGFVFDYVGEYLRVEWETGVIAWVAPAQVYTVSAEELLTVT